MAGGLPGCWPLSANLCSAVPTLAPANQIPARCPAGVHDVEVFN